MIERYLIRKLGIVVATPIIIVLLLFSFYFVYTANTHTFQNVYLAKVEITEGTENGYLEMNDVVIRYDDGEEVSLQAFDEEFEKMELGSKYYIYYMYKEEGNSRFIMKIYSKNNVIVNIFDKVFVQENKGSIRERFY